MSIPDIPDRLVELIDADQPSPQPAARLATTFAPASPGHRAADRLLCEAQRWLREHHCPQRTQSAVGWWRVAIATVGRLPIRKPLGRVDPLVMGWER